MDAPGEVERLFSRWLDRTIELHHIELRKQGVKGTGQLDKSIRGAYRRLGEGYLEGNLFFDQHGRFVDMGSSRGWSHGKRIGEEESNKRGTGGRKKKPWYGRVWYARINDLQGAVGYKMMEQVIDMSHKAIKK
jgi:hypothetical protein